MFSQKISRTCTVLLASFLLVSAHSVFANLVLNINQTNPYPAASTCPAPVGTTPVEVGGSVTYAFTVTNNGPTGVRKFSFTDSVVSSTNPAGVCIGSISAAGADCEKFCITPQATGFTVTTKEQLEPNQSFVFTATYNICTGFDANSNPPSSTLTNSASVTAVDCYGNTLTATDQLTSCVQGCALAALVLPSITTNVCQGSPITVTAQVAGNCESANNLTYTWFVTGSTVPVQTGNSNQYIVPAGSIPSCPATTSYSVVVTDNFTGCTVGPVSSATICSVPCADLSIVKTACVSRGLIVYTITVGNLSSDTPSLVTVTDCLPSNLTPIQVNGLGSALWNAVVTNNCLSVVLVNSSNQPITLLPGQAASFEIVAQVSGCYGKSICNTATVQGSVFDPNQSNNQARVKVKYGK